MPPAFDLTAAREAVAGSLTHPALTTRAVVVPSHTTLTATLLTAGVLVLLFTLAAHLVFSDAAPEWNDDGPVRGGIALALVVLAGAAGISLGTG